MLKLCDTILLPFGLAITKIQAQFKLDIPEAKGNHADQATKNVALQTSDSQTSICMTCIPLTLN